MRKADVFAAAVQGLELCLAPMPLSQLVLREGKAELGRLRRIYAFAGGNGWRDWDCLRYCTNLHSLHMPSHGDSLTMSWGLCPKNCNTESGRTNVFFLMNVFHTVHSNLEPAIHSVSLFTLWGRSALVPFAIWYADTLSRLSYIERGWKSMWHPRKT